jgi:CheY-like chemotaxis protein
MRSVLVVEDDEDIRNAVAEVLREEGFTVTEAENGRRALDRMTDRRPSVVVTDLMMPLMSGAELMRAMLRDERLATIPVIVMSAYLDALDALPAARCFRKPFDVMKLASAVRELAAV